MKARYISILLLFIITAQVIVYGSDAPSAQAPENTSNNSNSENNEKPVTEDKVYAIKVSSKGEVIDISNQSANKKFGVITLSKYNVKNLHQLELDFINLYEDPNVYGILVIMKKYTTDESLVDLIRDINKEKPVVGYAINGCGSAGYWILSSCSKIVAGYASEIGFIGSMKVFSGYELNEQATSDLIILSVGAPIFYHQHAEQDKISLQNRYNQFVNDVIKNRSHCNKFDSTHPEIWAEGKSFIAPEAESIGLIDLVGSTEDAITTLKALIKDKNPDINTDELTKVEIDRRK